MYVQIDNTNMYLYTQQKLALLMITFEIVIHEKPVSLV